VSNENITIGICAHNEEDTIEKLIEQVFEEDIPIEEIIIVVAGEDNTANIVAEKSRKSDELILIKEEKREGQIAAQNKILSKSTGEAIMLVDGDGTIKPGSLEKLYENFSGMNAVSGKEIPVTDNSFIGKIIELYGELHNTMCLQNPRFSTHLGIFPSNMIQQFPDVVLDDAYIEHKCLENDFDLEYTSEAVKYHHTPNSLRFFFHQQKKNWAGRFQAKQRGFKHSKPDALLVKIFIENLMRSSLTSLPKFIGLGIIELSAYMVARYNQLKDDFPVKWWRPK